MLRYAPLAARFAGSPCSINRTAGMGCTACGRRRTGGAPGDQAASRSAAFAARLPGRRPSGMRVGRASPSPVASGTAMSGAV